MLARSCWVIPNRRRRRRRRLPTFRSVLSVIPFSRLIGAPSKSPEMDTCHLNSNLRAEPGILSGIQRSRCFGEHTYAYVYVNAKELCGSAAQLGLFFVRRTIHRDQHCGANAFWRFLPYLIQPRSLARLFFYPVFSATANSMISAIRRVIFSCRWWNCLDFSTSASFIYSARLSSI